MAMTTSKAFRGRSNVIAFARKYERDAQPTLAMTLLPLLMLAVLATLAVKTLASADAWQVGEAPAGVAVGFEADQ